MDKEKIFEIIKIYAPDNIPIHEDSSFTDDLGMSSITMLTVILDIEQSVSCSLELGAFRKIKTIGDMISLIEKAEKGVEYQ